MPHLPRLDPDQGRGEAEGEGDRPAQPKPAQERRHAERNGPLRDVRSHDLLTVRQYTQCRINAINESLNIANKLHHC
jgi:hypothetical protein